MAEMRCKHLLGLLFWLALSVLVAIVGAIAAMNAGEFYAELNKPVWAPPAWLFSPVWTMLYVLMAISAWRVWKKVGFRSAQHVLVLYLVQLGFNAAWTWVFFADNDGFFAMANVLALWILLFFIVIGFWRKDKLAGILLIPYLAWVSFAIFLTYFVWQMNPKVLGI